MRALQPVLLRAQDELAAGLRAWLANAPDAEERFTAQHLRNALLQTRHALEHMEKVVPIGVEGTLRAMGVASGALATRHLQEEVAVFAGVFGHSVRPVQLQQAAIVAEGREQLIPRFRSSARRYGKDISADIRHQMAIGLASGETFSQLTDRLQRHGGPRGLVSLAGVLGEPGARSEYIAEGLFAKYRGWAARVVRTEANHAYGAHALIGLEQMDEEDPGYQKRWDATNDRVCPICKALDGEVADLDKPFSCGVMHPPIHPNDRCAVTPWRPEWAGPPVDGPTKPPVIEAPPPDAEAEKHRAAEEAARRRAEQERAAAAKREAEEDRRDEERRAALRREAEERAARQRAIEEETRRREAAAKAERERLAAQERQRVVATPPPAPAAPRLDAAAQATLDAVAKGGVDGLHEARLVMQRDFSKQGLHFSAGSSSGGVQINGKPAAVGAAAFNEVNIGLVVYSPETAAGAERFARRWKADPEATRAALAAAAVTPDAAYYKHLTDLRNKADDYEMAWRGMTKAKRAKIEADVAAGRDTEEARKRREHLDRKQKLDEAAAQAAVRTKQREYMEDFQRYRTVVHEEYHSFGPAWNASHGESGYHGAGAVIEEVATETLARRYLERFGASPEYLRRGGGYQREIDSVVHIVGDELKLDDARAWARLRDAADGYKRQAPARDQYGDDSPHGKLAEQLAGGDADLHRRIFDRFDKLKLGKEGG